MNIEINKKNLINYKSKTNIKNHILYSTKELLGLPYLWCGKSAFGFDCSGLVQSILKICDVNLPRDTSKQILSTILEENNREPDVGDLIFFKTNKLIDHIGLYINKMDFINSSGTVKINSINNKSKYYCQKLSKKYFKTFRIQLSN